MLISPVYSNNYLSQIPLSLEIEEKELIKQTSYNVLLFITGYIYI